MPFDKSFDDIYQYGIKQLCEDNGIVAERVDEQFYSEPMLERIYRQIENADFIIADMTNKNPNVFYEVGYAHAKGKLCALITQNSIDIPFDLKHHAHIIYDGKLKLLRSQLSPRLIWMKDKILKQKIEIISLSINKPTGFLEISEYSHEGSFDMKLLIKNTSAQRSPEIDNISLTVKSEWRIFVSEKECAFASPTKDIKKYFIQPPNIRIAPGALSQTEVTFKKTFWTKWSGSEKKESYNSSGRIHIEIATAEGIMPFDFDLNVDFDDIPF